MKYLNKYYIGGLISLIFLPILFFISTIEIRRKAISYGSIEVCAFPLGATDRYMFSNPPESLYKFTGINEIERYHNFNQFCQINKQFTKRLYAVNLPETCSYNFFIKIVEILQINQYMAGLQKGRIIFQYRPTFNFIRKYDPPSTNDEIRYIFSEIQNIYIDIRDYFSDEIAYSPRVLHYEDLGQPLCIFFNYDFSFPPVSQNENKDPRSTIYFRSIGNWFIPIIILWSVLFVISIRRQTKIVA